MLEKFFNQIFLDNSIKNYLIVLGVIIVALFVKRLFSKYVASLIAKLISRKNKPFNKKRFQSLVLSPIELFLMVLVITIAFESLNYPSILNFKVYRTSLGLILAGIANTTIIASFIWLCIRLLEYIAELLREKAALTNDRTEDQLIVFFKDFFKVIIAIIGFLLIVRFGFGKPIGDMLTGLSIVGAAIALAFRESMENLIASFIIFFDKPFTTGDIVKVQNITGTVERIGLRSTRIRTTDKTYVSVPNKQMVDSILDNQSLRTQRKVETNFELALGTSPQQIKDFVSRANDILQKEHVEEAIVFLSDTGIKSHIIHIEYWTNTHQSVSDFQLLRQTINLELIETLVMLKIDLAADKTDIVVHQAKLE